MAQEGAVAAEDYTIRLAQAGDREPFLSLYEDVWGRSKSEEWFEWRFERNPYATEVEMVVAERGETLVGAEPLLPMPLAVGADRIVSRQPVDWIVHPDHRRRGVFTRMTERLLSTFEDRTTLLFNFPSDALRPGLEKFDWTTVSEVTTRYRIHDVERIAAGEKHADSTTVGLLKHFAAPALSIGLGASRRLTTAPSDVTVERVDGVATDAIRGVYTETTPEAIHVPREEAYLEWRFANPLWETATYVARRGGDPVATVVVATESLPDSTTAYVLDTQPMATNSERAPAFAAALDAALDDLDTDIVKAPTDPFPSVLRRRGFLRDDNALLSRFSTLTSHAVRPLPIASAIEFDRDVLDDEEWLLMLGDWDIE
ncbi:GNAT family N-acetyltransferase [Halobacterium wangiae]|uniref:GNAT family N-acetyltransferase n=1 Tax=Halobacterium wangiae TaxID=2902623 RepID=UPI001E4B30F3|nr:GNAT family N-acetyltransferase [Halobacterium wangiae]